MTDVVVDATIVIKWLVDEHDSPKALALAEAWAAEGVRPAAPYLLPVEVANALRRRLLRDEITLPAAQRHMASVLDSGIDLLEPPGLHEEAVRLAYDRDVPTVHDAHYVALARHLGCELWTADPSLRRSFGGSLASVRLLGEYEPS